jgi:hypothetical protein
LRNGASFVLKAVGVVHVLGLGLCINSKWFCADLILILGGILEILGITGGIES